MNECDRSTCPCLIHSRKRRYADAFRIVQGDTLHDDEPSIVLAPAFWSDFRRRYWNRKPVAFRKPAVRDFPTAKESLEAIVAASDELRRGGDVLLRLYLEHVSEGESIESRYFASAVEFPKDHLPTREDFSLEAYARRAEQRFHGHRFGLFINDVQAHHFRHWLRMSGFLAGLYAAIGVPGGGVQSAIHFGTYRHTPFGIHKDEAHVFTFVVEGTKTMLVWPLESFSRKTHPEVPPDPEHEEAKIAIRDRAEYRRLMRSAVRLRGNPGDIIYWPPSYWHRSEPVPAPTCTIALLLKPTGWEFLRSNPEPLRNAEASTLMPPRQALPGKKVYRLPKRVSDAIREKRLEPARQRSGNGAMRSWMSFATSRGFVTPAPLDRDATLKGVSAVRANPRRPIVRARVDSRHVLVACNGWTQRILAHPRLLELIELLNSGSAVNLRNAKRDFSGRATRRGVTYEVNRNYVRDLVLVLLRWRAVSPCRPEAVDPHTPR
ncbi:MAG: hypothetical protein QOD06_842 [Candidatus Binatota bacterium]|nr:hypothetical protein [Candidatus Binatota bacterium]